MISIPNPDPAAYSEELLRTSNAYATEWFVAPHLGLEVRRVVLLASKPSRGPTKLSVLENRKNVY